MKLKAVFCLVCCYKIICECCVSSQYYNTASRLTPHVAHSTNVLSETLILLS